MPRGRSALQTRYQFTIQNSQASVCLCSPSGCSSLGIIAFGSRLTQEACLKLGPISLRSPEPAIANLIAHLRIIVPGPLPPSGLRLSVPLGTKSILHWMLFWVNCLFHFDRPFPRLFCSLLSSSYSDGFVQELWIKRQPLSLFENVYWFSSTSFKIMPVSVATHRCRASLPDRMARCATAR